MSDGAGYLYKIDEVIPGTRLRVCGRLGCGGMGSVYEVAAPPKGERYVVKVLHPHLLGGGMRVRERIRKEGVLLTQLDHPNVVQVLFNGETGDEPPLPFYVMERLDGWPLSEVMRRVGSGLPFIPACEIMSELLAALAYAHARGVVHRDVKLDNIFLHVDRARRRVTKLLDFGIVRILSETRATVGGFLGTLGAAAPEQIRGDDPSPACDVYSAGIALYHVLTWRDPFGELADDRAIVRAHLTAAPRPPSAWRSIPRELDELVLAMLEKRPTSRPHTSQVIETLRRMANEIGSDARFDPPDAMRRWCVLEAELLGRARGTSPGNSAVEGASARASSVGAPAASGRSRAGTGAGTTSELDGIVGLELPPSASLLEAGGVSTCELAEVPALEVTSSTALSETVGVGSRDLASVAALAIPASTELPPPVGLRSLDGPAAGAPSPASRHFHLGEAAHSTGPESRGASDPAQAAPNLTPIARRSTDVVIVPPHHGIARRPIATVQIALAPTAAQGPSVPDRTSPTEGVRPSTMRSPRASGPAGRGASRRSIMGVAVAAVLASGLGLWWVIQERSVDAISGATRRAPSGDTRNAASRSSVSRTSSSADASPVANSPTAASAALDTSGSNEPGAGAADARGGPGDRTDAHDSTKVLTGRPAPKKAAKPARPTRPEDTVIAPDWADLAPPPSGAPARP